MLLLGVPAFSIRGLPRHQQSVPGYRSRTEGRSSKGNGHHGHWGGVAPVDGSEAEEITFKSRQKICQMARVTGTKSQESDLEAASKLWEELGREEEPTLIARFG